MDFVELLNEYRIPFKRHGENNKVSEGWYGLKCPWCDEGRGNYGLGYNTRGGYLSCWKCGPRSLTQFLHTVTGMGYREANAKIDVLDRPRHAGPRPRGVYKEPSGLCVGLEPPHEEYLRNRGFDPREVERIWKVDGTSLNERLPWRLFIPIIYNGQPVSWTTRAIAKGTPHHRRYVSARPEEEAIPHRRILYGVDFVRSAVIVHEGPIDVWATGPGAVATMGTGYTPAQVELLSRVPLRVIAFDSDRMAQRRAKALCRDLAAFPGRTLQVRLSCKDAASCPKEEIAELRKRFLE